MEKVVWLPQSSSSNGGLLRIIFVGLLGLYAAGHFLFVPMEIVGIILCNDPLLQSSLPFLLLVLLVKYITFIGMFFIGYRVRRASIGYSLLILLQLALLTAGAYFINEKIVAMKYGSLLESPYLFDYLGCVICGIFGMLHMFIGAVLQSESYEYALVSPGPRFAYYIPQ